MENRPGAATQPISRSVDPMALEVARTLRDAIDAECVILFGSRCRSDWTERSDLDLMIINPELPDPPTMYGIQEIARQIVNQIYPTSLDIDFVYMSSEEYDRKSRRTINSVARMARREGIKMPRNPGSYSGHHDDDDRNDYSEEYIERERRIADANMHYRSMHGLLDLGFEDRNTAYNAHQALEHGMKALISAQGFQYPHSHNLTLLANTIRQHDPERHRPFQSNLEQLNNYAGGPRYGPLPNPVRDFRQMANDVTDDLEQIHQQIAQLTGEDPWSVPPEGTTGTVRPRRR